MFTFVAQSLLTNIFKHFCHLLAVAVYYSLHVSPNESFLNFHGAKMYKVNMFYSTATEIINLSGRFLLRFSHTHVYNNGPAGHYEESRLRFTLASLSKR